MAHFLYSFFSLIFKVDCTVPRSGYYNKNADCERHLNLYLKKNVHAEIRLRVYNPEIN